MVNRFTERARRVMVLATEEARSRRHEAVGPEHVLNTVRGNKEDQFALL